MTTSLGPITPIRCTMPDCYWSCHGVPDKYAASRAQILADHITSEHAPQPETVLDGLEPTLLRWGLDDVMYGDDDTTTVLLSGPSGEPYWVELDSERTAALREALAGPEPVVARRILGTTEQADTVAAPEADRAAVLTDRERQFLTFALDMAAEELALGAGFTDEDRAALDHLRRMADAAQQPTPAPAEETK